MNKAVVKKKTMSKRKREDWIAGYVFIAPLVIGLSVFYIWPFLQNFWFSFNEVNKFNVATFKNYLQIRIYGMPHGIRFSM